MGDDLDIRGGVGGVVARTDDMRRHGELLDGTGDELRGVAAQVAAATDPGLLLATAPFAPRSGAAAQAAVVGAAGAVAALAARTELAAERLRLTAAAVLAADVWPRRAGRVLVETTAPATMALAVGAVGVASLAGAVEGGLDAVHRTDQPDGPAVGDRMRLEVQTNIASLLHDAPWLVDGVVHGSPHVVRSLLASTPAGLPFTGHVSTREGLVVQLLGLGSGVGLLVDTPIDVTPAGTSVRLPGPASLSDVVRLQQQLMERATPDPQASRLQVLRTTTADGLRSWVVLVPGTQEWPVRSGGDPSDLTSNAHLTVADRLPTDPSILDAVDDAMRLAGVAPDDPVLLAGHSQGGITAAAFARVADERGYTVTHVFTQGSPIQNLVPPGVHTLSLEHTNDIVPRLDSGLNADTLDHTTVRREVDVPVTANIAYGHGLGEYRRTTELAVVAGDPSVAAFDAEVAALYTTGAEAIHLEFEMRRVQEPGG